MSIDNEPIVHLGVPKQKDQMKFSLFWLFALLSFASYSQDILLPFEFDRSTEIAFDGTKSDFNSDKDALHYYIEAFKAQRIENPDNYFPTPNSARNRASDFLKGKNIELITFLESQGDLESSQGLSDTPTLIPEMLPYQFMAAYLLQDKVKMNQYLKQMDGNGMISPVLKAFGSNMQLSLSHENLILTQGLQDLIAISWAQRNAENPVPVANRFMEKCGAYRLDNHMSYLNSPEYRVWVSPVVAADLYKQFNLSRAGMGLVESGSLDNTQSIEQIARTGKDFEGLDLTPQTEADKGLIRSYRDFAETLEQVAEIRNDKPLEKKASQLIKYAKKY